MPNLVFENLNDLTEPEPNFRHQYFVDLTPFIKNTGNPATTGNHGKLLVSGLGKGGRGYFCLNVDDPTNMKDDTNPVSWVKWEYPNSSSTPTERNNMGYTYGQAFIVKSYTESGPAPSPRWVALFANGYESASETAALYILDAGTGELLRMLDTGASGNNGLSTPLPVDINGQGKGFD